MVTLFADRVPRTRNRRLCGLWQSEHRTPFGEHPALQERSVFVDLAQDLAVRVVDAGIEKGGAESIQKGVGG